VEYSGKCAVSVNGIEFSAGAAHLIARGDVEIVGWYGFVESLASEWDAVPPSEPLKIRLPSGSIGDITIKTYTPGATIVRVEGRGPVPW
jgi:hypothetical protein